MFPISKKKKKLKKDVFEDIAVKENRIYSQAEREPEKMMAEVAKHIEDDFDLNQFKQNTEAKTKEKANQKNKTIANFLTLLIVIISISILYQVYIIGSYYYDLWNSSKATNVALELFGEELEKSIYVETETPPDVTASISEPPTAEPAATEPLAKEEVPYNEGIAALQTEFGNLDITAYLYIKDTNINNPVVQGEDDAFYLKHDLYKKQNVNGTLFLDSANSRDFTDRNSVIYGHNMKNGTMFHNLRYYRQKDYYNEHKYITLITERETTTWEIFAAFESTTEFNYIQTSFSGDEEFSTFIKTVKQKTPFSTGVEVTTDDIILTLSTCTNTADNMRFVVQGKLIERK